MSGVRYVTITIPVCETGHEGVPLAGYEADAINAKRRVRVDTNLPVKAGRGLYLLRQGLRVQDGQRSDGREVWETVESLTSLLSGIADAVERGAFDESAERLIAGETPEVEQPVTPMRQGGSKRNGRAKAPA
jgi:hypothetical protein